MNLANSAASRYIFDWDYFLWEVRWKLLAAGFFIYLGLFLLAHLLSSWFSASYRTLSGKEKAFWNMSITSGLFAVQSCGAGLWALFIDPVFQIDQVHSEQKWSWFHCLIAAGFFLHENVVIHVSNIVFRMFDVFSVVHNLFAFGGCQGSSPTLNSRVQMWGPIGCANTLFWKANQWVNIHMFHCRMVLIYHMWWVCISHWNDVVENLGLPYFVVFFMGLSTLTLILNPYWTYRSTQWLFGLVDRNFQNTAVENGSSGKLNSGTFQKKRL
ncbi:unnamed protein product [Lepidochelys olivacea]